jgi:glycosyltransferase involved in cell wall biosynthesis
LAWREIYGVPLVATYHGLIQAGLDVLPGKAELIGISEKVREHLGVECHMIENGIDLEEFPSSPLPMNRTVAWLGRIEGFRWLMLDALFRATESLDIRCRIAGPYLSPDAVELLSGYKHVEWYGAIFDTAPFIRDVDIVFSTSRGIREAMASGRVAVVANHMWYGGIVQPATVEKMRKDSFMAFMEQPVLSTAIQEDLKSLYDQPNLMTALGRWGHGYISLEFPAEKMIEATEAVYHKAIANIKAIR